MDAGLGANSTELILALQSSFQGGMQYALVIQFDPDLALEFSSEYSPL